MTYIILYNIESKPFFNQINFAYESILYDRVTPNTQNTIQKLSTINNNRLQILTSHAGYFLSIKKGTQKYIFLYCRSILFIHTIDNAVREIMIL